MRCASGALKALIETEGAHINPSHRVKPAPARPTKARVCPQFLIEQPHLTSFFNVHDDRVSTTSAQGKIKIGVSNLIITEFGLERFKVE